MIFVVPDYALSDNTGGVSVLVAPVAVAAPVLSILPGPGTVIVLWPTNAVGYQLEQNADLQSSPWNSVTNVPLGVSTNLAVTLPGKATNSHFRLHPP